MIRRIGIGNILLIIVLAFLAGCIFLYNTYSLAPELLEDQREIQKNEAKIAEMSNNVASLQQGVNQFSEQREEYEHLLKLGFFNSQKRIEIRDRMDAIRDASGVLFSTYTVNAAAEEESELANDANHRLLKTTIDIELGALEDISIYRFVYLLNNGFPGHVEIQSLLIQRQKEVTQPLLRRIGSGEYEPLITGKLKLSWLTMVPSDTVQMNDERTR